MDRVYNLKGGLTTVGTLSTWQHGSNPGGQCAMCAISATTTCVQRQVHGLA
jgi:hypothetical protein